MKKRGLSGVIVTLLMIVISITAIVIVWAVIKNIVESGSGDVGLDAYTIDLKVQRVVQSTNSANITIKRNTGQGTLSGLKFIISDGINKQTFEQKNINFSELETKIFTIPYSSLIKTIEIAPIVSLQGKESLQNVIETFDLPATNALKNMPGLVSWYRFEGNANDEMGINNGLNYNAGNSTQGKFGFGYSFPNPINPNPIPITNSLSLNLSNYNYTIISWINPGTMSAPKRPIFWKGTGNGNLLPSDEYGLIIQRTAGITQNLYGGTNKSSVRGNINITAFGNKWIQVANSQEFHTGGNTITKVYVEGNLDSQATDTAELTTPTPYDSGIGSSSTLTFAFLGSIDEVMIFNKTLSDQEIHALYNLDLS